MSVVRTLISVAWLAPLAAGQSDGAPIRAEPARPLLSGLGDRGPRQLHPAAFAIDPEQAHAAALAVYAGRPLAVDPRFQPIAASAAPEPAARDALGVGGPSFGYGLLGLIALCGLWVAARRHRSREIMASAFDGLDSTNAPD